MPSENPNPRKVFFLLEGILYSALVLYAIRFLHFPNRAIYWRSAYLLLFIAMLLVWRQYRSIGLATDICVIVAFMWWIYRGIGYSSSPFTFLPLIVCLWLSAVYRLQWRYSPLLAWCLPAAWFLLSRSSPPMPTHTSHYLVLGSSFLMLSVYTLMRLGRPKAAPARIDCLVSSYSGNTAHFADLFMQGARSRGAEVILHRFHHFKSFSADFAGDALAIAFPVYGCKPPWPLLYYLAFKLPRGGGKSACILYTCIGGAENAGIVCWLLLTLKGYRVTGRNMSVYPVNIATFRLGPRRLWKRLDGLFPRRGDLTYQIECGRDFADGELCGIPFIFALTPAFLFGIALDNKLFDTLLYRNHVFKKRCTQCGICVDFCPAERLTMVDGYPKAKGTCMICLGCVNICPTNAMHLWCWTEYGNRYPPKYKKFVAQKEINKNEAHHGE